MFNYEFMIIAFVVGILLSIIIPLIGTNLVFKRMSMTGDALSHTSLAGVAIGLLCGFNPIVGAMITSVIAAIITEIIRKKFQKYSELSLAVILSVGVGLAGILSSYTPAANFDTYLFGSIIAISMTEVYISVALTIVVLLYFILFYKEILYTSFSENSAKIAGVNVSFINFSYTILSALTIAIATKVIGALLVSSLIVIPVAISLQFSKSYKMTIINAIITSMVSVMSGIIISFYAGWKPGATIVLIAVGILAVTMLVKVVLKLQSRIKLRRKV